MDFVRDTYDCFLSELFSRTYRAVRLPYRPYSALLAEYPRNSAPSGSGAWVLRASPVLKCSADEPISGRELDSLACKAALMRAGEDISGM